MHGALDVRPQRVDAESFGKTCVNVRVVRSGVDHNGDPRPLAPFCDQLTGEGLDRTLLKRFALFLIDRLRQTFQVF